MAEAEVTLVFLETRAEIVLKVDGEAHAMSPDEAVQIAELLVMGARMATEPMRIQ